MLPLVRDSRPSHITVDRNARLAVVGMRRYTETRRRHPLAPTGRVIDGIEAETALLAPLREAADMVLDTTDLPLSSLRSVVESRFGGASATFPGMTISLASFAYPRGLPRDADLVFDARFLRNPHYDPMLRPGTGLDRDVAAFVEADPAFEPFLTKVTDLLSLLLPRFVEEGKKYVGIAVGCTGGRHRSVHVVQCLASRLDELRPAGSPPWRVTVNHRELARDLPKNRSEAGGQTETVSGASNPGMVRPAQAQEA